jgi:hypothetical protein
LKNLRKNEESADMQFREESRKLTLQRKIYFHK